MIISIFYGHTYGFLRDLLSKLLKNRTNRGSGPVSGPGPARSGPGPQDFSPVRSGTPGTLQLTKFQNDFVVARPDECRKSNKKRFLPKVHLERLQQH